MTMNIDAQHAFYRFKLPHQADKVPDDVGGIYSFTLRFPTDYELGLIENEEVAIKIVKMLVDKYARVYSVHNLTGFISDDKADHLMIGYGLKGSCEVKILPSDLMDDINLGDTHKLREIVNLIRISFEVSVPLYVGLTFEQSLRDRLEQHLNGSTSLKGYLKEFGLSWDNFYFNCNPINTLNKKELRGSEKLIQSIFKPKFSIN